MSARGTQALALLATFPTCGAARLDAARPWVLACTELVHPLPPLLFIVELGRALHGAPTHDEPPDAPAPLLRAIQRYREHVTSRIVDARLLPSLRDALVAIPEPMRPRAIAATCAAVIARIGQGLKAPRAAAVRRQLQRPSSAILDDAADALRDPQSLAETAASLETLATNARRAGQLFHEADVFVLEHFDRLPTSASRLAFHQAAAATSEFERRLPRHVRSRRPSQGEQTTTLEDESTYPTGGFSSITTTGPLENMVPSELAYLEERTAVDLFDIRYATGELLKYTRDEGRHRRPCRTATFEFDVSMSRSRVKDLDAPWQRLTLAVGLVAACVRRLLAWWGEGDIRIDVRFPSGLDDARGWLELLLHDAIGRHQVMFEFSDGPTEAADRVVLSAPEGLALCLHHDPSVVQLDSERSDLGSWIGVGSDLLHALA